MEEEKKNMSIDEMANEEGLDVITTTDSIVGYPSKLLLGALLDKDCMAKYAVWLSEAYHCRIEKVYKKAGWNVWSRAGDLRRVEPFDMIRLNSENVRLWQDTEEDRAELLEKHKQEIMEADSYEKVKEISERYNEIYDALYRAHEDSLVRTDFGKFTDIIPRYPMAYEDDGTQYGYALIKKQDN